MIIVHINVSIMGHPLLCWDIVMEGVTRRATFANDIKGIGKIMLANDWTPPAAALDSSLIWENKTILITDVSLAIVLATENIYKMNGYKPAEVMGRQPKMFQGAATTALSKQLIKTAVHNKLPFNCSIINYRKDGRLYNCHIEGHPIFNTQGKLVNFIALETAS